MKKFIDTVIALMRKTEESFNSGAEILNFHHSIQLDGYSCGAQCAYSILRYWNKKCTIDSVRDALGTDEKGYTSQTSIYKLFRRRGLKISDRKRTKIGDIMEAIDDYEAPMLITVDDEFHWCVVYGYSEGKIFVMNPLPIISSTFCGWRKKDFRDRWDRWGAIIYQ